MLKANQGSLTADRRLKRAAVCAPRPMRHGICAKSISQMTSPTPPTAFSAAALAAEESEAAETAAATPAASTAAPVGPEDTVDTAAAERLYNVSIV